MDTSSRYHTRNHVVSLSRITTLAGHIGLIYCFQVTKMQRSPKWHLISHWHCVFCLTWSILAVSCLAKTLIIQQMLLRGYAKRQSF